MDLGHPRRLSPEPLQPQLLPARSQAMTLTPASYRDQ